MKFNKENAPVGTRCLIRQNTYRASIMEVTVIEWAKSAKYVKLKYECGNEVWDAYIVDDGEIVEILPQKSKVVTSSFADKAVICLTCDKTIYPCSHMLVEFSKLVTFE